MVITLYVDCIIELFRGAEL